MNKLLRFIRLTIKELAIDVGFPILMIVCGVILFFGLGSVVGNTINYFHPINTTGWMRPGVTFPPPLTTFGTIVLVLTGMVVGVITLLVKIVLWFVKMWEEA